MLGVRCVISIKWGNSNYCLGAIRFLRIYQTVPSNVVPGNVSDCVHIGFGHLFPIENRGERALGLPVPVWLPNDNRNKLPVNTFISRKIIGKLLNTNILAHACILKLLRKTRTHLVQACQTRGPGLIFLRPAATNLNGQNKKIKKKNHLVDFFHVS